MNIRRAFTVTNEELVMNFQKSKDPETLSAICEQNKRLVYSIARRYIGATCRHERTNAAAVIGSDDLMQMGYIGLIQAAERWDSSGGASFATFARLWVRQSIVRELELSGFTIRLPSYRWRQCAHYERFIVSYEQEHGTKPTNAEIAAFMGVNVEMVEQIAFDASLRRAVSLETPIVNSEGECTTLSDYIGATDEALEMVELDADRERLAAVVAGVLRTLPEKQQLVLHGRFWKGQTLKEIGEEIGSSAENVREHERKALKRLGQGHAAKVLSPYFEKDYAKALSGTLSKFMRTHTSSTEWLAIKHYEMGDSKNWMRHKDNRQAKREKWEQEMRELYEACGMDYDNRFKGG